MAAGSAAADSQARQIARIAILPAGVLLLLGVVALASRAPLRPPGAAPVATAVGKGGSVSPWTLALFGIGAVTMLGSLALNLLSTRRREIKQRTKWPILFLACLAWSLLLLGAIFAARRLGGVHHPTSSLRVGQAHSLASRAHARGVQFPWWAQLSVALVFLAAGVLMASTVGRRWRSTADPTPPTLAPKVAEAVDQSLDDLEADPDARRAIIAAYRRMEESLADVGLPREGPETAREYLSRGLASLELSPHAIGTLTTLFERARFSLHHLDLRLRDEAIAALRAVQKELAGA